jgi:NTE family protein
MCRCRNVNKRTTGKHSARAATEFEQVALSVAWRVRLEYCFRQLEQLRTAFNELLVQLPAALAASPQARMLANASNPALYNIVELVYRSPTYEGQSKDFEFSRRTMTDHWQAGYADAGTILAHDQVRQLPRAEDNPALYDFVTNRLPRSAIKGIHP